MSSGICAIVISQRSQYSKYSRLIRYVVTKVNLIRYVVTKVTGYYCLLLVKLVSLG